MFGSLVVPVDLSPASARVVRRAALLPLAEGARLTLLHVVPGSLPRRLQQRARGDAKKALAERAKDLLRQLPPKAEVEVVVVAGSPAGEIAEHARTLEAELVVLGRGGRTLRDVFLGSTAERVLRRTQVPVLVVRLAPRAPYRRPALALDLDRAARAVIDLLLRVVAPPRPIIDVIHAYDSPYLQSSYPSLSTSELEAYGKKHEKEALRRIQMLLAGSIVRGRLAPSDAPSFRTHVRPGAPRKIIEHAVEKNATDLLALGTHGYTGLERAFLGTVAGDVLRAVTCDVLMVPPPPEADETPR
ncbi:MAG: universal stress protein [Pseudomonadota bacterium]|nr:MAG: universal stress protein [Pseudomonadota bacterium]